MTTTSRTTLAAAAALAVVGGALVAVPALAAAPNAPVIFTMANTMAKDGGPNSFLPVHADGDAQVISATTAGINVNVSQDRPVNIQLAPADGDTLHVGRYTTARGGASPVLLQIQQGSSSWTTGGQFDVLDLAADPDGTLTGFDIVFRSDPDSSAGSWFGQIRMGEDEAAVRPTATTLSWPTTPVRAEPVTEEQAITNTSDHPAVIGQAAVRRSSAADWSIAADTCSGTVLAPGASCTMEVGFSPRAAGPRFAELVVPVDGGSVSTTLTGTAPPGITRITTSGNRDVHQGATVVTKESDHQTVLKQTMSPGEWRFDAVKPNRVESGHHNLTLRSPRSGGPFTAGTHAVASGPVDGYGFDLGVDGIGCGSWRGTEKVTNLAFAPDGKMERVHVTFALDCFGKKSKAELLWRHRSDVTPPTAPRGLTRTGTTVTWSPSTSADRANTIVRLVPGDGTGADPTAGVPVTMMKGAGRATLPTLPAGTPAVLMAWAVDTTGNVSTPATLALG